MTDESVFRFLNEIFPSRDGLPMGSQIFADQTGHKNWQYLRLLVSDNSFGNTPINLFKLMKGRIPAPIRAEFLEWLVSVYVSNESIFRYLYDSEVPLASVSRVVEEFTHEEMSRYFREEDKIR